MTQIIKTALLTANIPLLDQQLKAALPVVCYGITADRNGLSVVLADEATPADIATALNVALVHNPALETTEQAAEKVGKVNVASLLSAADTAIAQLAAKRATFQTTPTLANAAPLLVEIGQDLEGVIKALKYVLTRIQ